MRQRRRSKLETKPVAVPAPVTVVSSGVEGAVLDCDLVYDPADPFATSMVFRAGDQAPVTWTFGRDLLVQGLNEPAGVGDVHIRPCLKADGQAGVSVLLSSPDGELELQASRRDVQRFVGAILQAVPVGDECRASDIDGELDGIFA